MKVRRAFMSAVVLQHIIRNQKGCQMWEGGWDLAFFWQFHPKEHGKKCLLFDCLVEVN